MRVCALLCGLLAGFMLPSAHAWVVHIDVVVGASGGQLTTDFCAGGAGCDSVPAIQALNLPPGALPVHGATGQQIFVTDFGDFAGGPFATDNPGFFAAAGELPPDLLLRYEITNNLLFWDAGAGAWAASTPNDERIRLAGGIDAVSGEGCPLLVCFVKSSTVITTRGVEGAPSLIIDKTASNGSLHTHLDWFMELPDGTRSGAAGAYLVELRMVSEGLRPSDPVMVLFNRGLSDTAFVLSLQALMNVQAPPSVAGEQVLFPGGDLFVPASTTFVLSDHRGTASESFTLVTGAFSGAGDIDLGGNWLFGEFTSDAAFSGRISGTGGVRKSGPGRLILSGINSYRGDTYVSGPVRINDDRNFGAADGRLFLADAGLEAARSLTLSRTIVASGENTFDTGVHTLTLDGALRGSGVLHKRGSGTLALEGRHPFSGLALVHAGRLHLAGSLGGSLGMAAGTTLTGQGEVGGDLHLAEGSRYQVSIDPAGLADPRLRVRGRARLDQPRLDIDARPGEYAPHSVHTILRADGGISGSFGEVSSNLAFLTPRLISSGNEVRVQMSRNDRGFTDFARGSDQRGIARALDSFAAAPGGDALAVVQALGGLVSNEVGEVLESVSGLPLTALPSALGTQSNAVMRQIGARLGHVAVAGPVPGLAFNRDTDILLAANGLLDPRLHAAASSAATGDTAQQRHGAWLRGLFGFGRFDVGPDARSDSDHAGVIAGYDWLALPELTLGGFGVYTDATLRQDAPRSSTNVTSWQLGGYGRYQSRRLHVDALVSYGEDDVKTSRRMVIGNLQRSANASFDGNNLNAYLETGYSIDAGWLLQPYVALQWTRQRRGAYQEHGAGALDLAVEAHRSDSVRSLAGARARAELMQIRSGAVLGELRLAWAHEFAGDTELRARLNGDPAATLFVVQGTRAPRNAAVIGAGLVANLNEHAQAFADFDGAFDSAHQTATVSAGVRIRW